MTRGLAILVAAFAVGCAHRPEWPVFERMPHGDLPARSLDGDVRIECAVRDAEVYLDGVLQGTAGDFDGTQALLKTGDGPHRIEIRKPGFAPYQTDFVSGNTVVVLSVHLQPI